MIHLGDITKISGFDVPITDCVIGGSPCQDLSVAGRRAGMSKECENHNCDFTATGNTELERCPKCGAKLRLTRSGLFMEQIRLIKEMRENDRRSGKPDHLLRPRFMLWENVPGAFSSQKGEDFRAVLEETIRIIDPDSPPIPLPPKGKWPMADCWYGDGWSLAYRVFDAQFWGVPQRRRRIALVCDFGGHAAPEILFIRKGLCGDFAESEEPREDHTAGAGERPAETVFCIQGNCIDRADTAGCNGKGWTEDVSYTLNTIDRPAVAAIHLTQDPIVSTDITPCLSAGNPEHGQCSIAVFENHGQDSRFKGPLNATQPVTATYGMGGNNTPLVVQAAGFKANQGAKAHSIGYEEEVAPTLNTDTLPPAVLQTTKPYCIGNGQAAQISLSETVRTLDCMHDQQAIIQNVPIGIGRDAFNQGQNAKFGMTIEHDLQPPLVAKGPGAVESQQIVRRLTPLECERLQGYPDGWTDIGEWIDTSGKVHKESSDSARYKALGNSIALPPWKWVIKRLCGCYERSATMASLFDGIGGFPLIWEQFNGKGSCLWASEIEEFPIAVTKRHFTEEERK